MKVMCLYTTEKMSKLYRLQPSVHRYTILNNWNPSRNINFLQECKNCLNSLLKGSQTQEKLCQVSESCCSARAPLEDAVFGREVLPTVPTQQQSTSVIVIGAGIAGLSTANHLKENGVTNVTVLEATDRPGGRIQSRFFGDSIIELGSPIERDSAGDVHPIFNTVVEDGLTTYQLNNADRSRGLLMRSDGSVIPYPVTFDAYQIFKKIWKEVHDIEYEQSGQGKHSTMTLLGNRAEQEARMFPSKYQNDATRVLHALASLTLSKSNHDTSLIFSNSFGDYLQIPGSSIQVPLGHFGEINSLYEGIPKDQVLFNKAVTKIKWGGVADVFPRAIVICEDGESFQADYVIITVPLGVLKALADTLFCPGLPSRKLNAILKIPMGFTNKVFLEFTEPFWKWKMDFEKICYDPKKMACKDGWLKGVSSIEPLRGSDHVICVTVAGLQAQCMESVPDKEIICGVVSLLKESSPNKSVPEPVKIKRTSWSSDPNFYGAYSFMDPVVCSKDFYDLAAPLPEQSELCDPVLLFAGEATCPVHFGTVRGAKNSGVREAERLLQLLRLQNEIQPNQAMKMGCGF